MGLSKEPHDAVAFYSAVAASGMLGIGLTLSPLNPIKALYWSAVINGVGAVPVMIVIMLMTGEKRIMGKFVIGGWLRWLGWASTAAMTICVGAMIAAWIF
jgi:Mn2+/Fe2+ NRAMP family transporter